MSGATGEREGKRRGAALDHLVNVEHIHAVRRECSGFPDSCPEERSIFRRLSNVGQIDVLKQNLLEVVPDGDLARLAAFLFKVQHPLIAGVIKIAATESGHGAAFCAAGLARQLWQSFCERKAPIPALYLQRASV